MHYEEFNQFSEDPDPPLNTLLFCVFSAKLTGILFRTLK